MFTFLLQPKCKLDTGYQINLSKTNSNSGSKNFPLVPFLSANSHLEAIYVIPYFFLLQNGAYSQISVEMNLSSSLFAVLGYEALYNANVL